CHLVALEEQIELFRVALGAPIEGRERPVADLEEAQHRRHAIESYAQFRRLDVPLIERFLHHAERTKRIQERLGRTADMPAIGKNLPRNLCRETLDPDRGVGFVLKTEPRERERGCGMKSRYAVGCFQKSAREHPRLIAKRAEEPRPPWRVTGKDEA